MRDTGGIVVCSILESTPERTRLELERAPAACALVEIRADHLRAEDVASLVRSAGRDSIVTVRSARDGGAWADSESARRRMLEGALVAGARYVDVEHAGPLADLAEGEHAARVILSHHGAECAIGELRAVYRSMSASRAAVLKIVPRCERPAQAAAVKNLLAEFAAARPLGCFAVGRAGMLTRILAPSWGSWASYGSAGPGRETAAGQLTARDLLSVHDVARIRGSTRRFAIVGSAVSTSPSPAMHRAGYLAAGIDARYLAIEIDHIEDCLPLVGRDGLAGIEALAVTMPLKQAAARHCVRLDPVAERASSVNTVLVADEGWAGFNTDGPAIAALVRGHLDPRGARVAIAGAGGTARAAAHVLAEAGAEVVLFNRDLSRARAAAAAVGATARPLADLGAATWDVLVQATPLGRQGERLLEADQLRGRFVLDAVYGRATPLVTDAAGRGIPLADGLDLLVAQGLRQFERMTGARADAEAMRAAANEWLVHNLGGGGRT